ncbi:MAG: hypothetical protein ABEL76_02000 [Bradymonadaceae bacterium]
MKRSFELTTIALLTLTLVAAACGGDSNQTVTGGGSDTGSPDGGSDATMGDTTDGGGGGMDADAGMTDATADGGDGTSQSQSLRLYGIVEKPGEGKSRIFGIQTTARPGEGGSSLFDKSFGVGDIGLVETGSRLFALDQRCTRKPDECDKPAGRAVELEPKTGSTGGVFELPDGTYNPKDVAFVGEAGRFYVTAYSSSKLHVFDTGGNRMATTYDLGQFDPNPDADGDPEAFEMMVDGKYVLVVLQALKKFSAKSASRIAVLDTDKGSFVDFDESADGTQALKLNGKNAFGGLTQAPDGDLVVGATGSFGKKDGAVLRIKRNGPGDYENGSTLVTEKQLGGDLTDVVVHGNQRGYAVVQRGGPDTPNRVKLFDASGEGDPEVTSVSAVNDAAGALCLGPDRKAVAAWDSGASPPGYQGFTATTRYPLWNGTIGPEAPSRGCLLATGNGAF